MAVALALPACSASTIIFALVIFSAYLPTIIARRLTTTAVVAILSAGTVAVAQALLARPSFTIIFALIMLSAKYPAVILLVLTLAWPIQAEFVRAVLVGVRAIGLVFAFTAEA